MANPIGITIKAGPGNTISIIPNIKTVNPIIVTTIFLSLANFTLIRLDSLVFVLQTSPILFSNSKKGSRNMLP